MSPSPRRLSLAALTAAALFLGACGDDGGGDDPTFDEDVTTTTADGATTSTSEGDEEAGASAGSFCEQVPDDEMSELVGAEVSSADVLFNNADSCTYESEDLDVRVSISRTPEIPGTNHEIFLQTVEQNSDTFEELDGPGDAAYFHTTGDNAGAGAIVDGQVYSVGLDVAGDDDPTDHRDAVVDLLERIAG